MISELTEITEEKEERVTAGLKGWILYDGECRYCIAAAKQFERVFGRRGFRFLPLQTPWVQRQLHLIHGEPLTEMRVLTSRGQDFGGADAVLFLARQVWWLRPIAIIGRLPAIHRLIDVGYRWIAAHRGCTHLQCSTEQHLKDRRSALWHRLPADELKKIIGRRPTPLLQWAALILPILALVTLSHVAPWAFMWIMAGAIFFSCKWITLWRVKPQLGHISLARIISYFFLWTGLDAASFLGPRQRRPKKSDVVKMLSHGLLKTVLGAMILFGCGRLSPHPLVAGWIGMIGLVLLLHFGLFDVASVIWRLTGVNAGPIMNAPIASTSLSEFWGRRWNSAFNQLVIVLFFRDFSRRFGTIRATLTAFLISGLLHELVISLPAGGGYGLPTGYFLLQGWAVLAQRIIPVRLGLRRGFGGWLFTMFFTAAPAFWLFHPLFVRRVILPFMQAIGAL